MKSANILVVDDKAENLFLIQELISEYLSSCEVIATQHPEEGLTIAAERDLDGVITDVQMPVMDGIEMCRRLKANPISAHLPVILLTAHDSSFELKVRGIEAGADDFIIRPIGTIEFVAKIKVMLRIKRAEDELRAANSSLDRQVAERTAELRESEENLRSISTMASDAIIMLDPKSKITFWNKAAEKIFGYTNEEATGKDRDLLVLPNRYRNSHRAKDFHFQENGTGAENGKIQETKGLRKDGNEFPIELTISPVRLRGEWYAVAIIRDITERKRSEEKLRESEERLRQAQKLHSIGKLAGGVAHDFSNLLTIIIGYSDLIISTEQNLDDTKKEGLQEIKNAGEKAAALTQQLLAFSRKQVLQPQVINLNRLFTELGKMLKRLIGENIDLSTEFDSEPGHIKADYGQMEQVIMNLVVNARDAMPKGGESILKPNAYT